MQAEHTIEFKDFKHDNYNVSADMHLNGKFVVRFVDNIEHLLTGNKTNITLYEYFRAAAKEYLSYEKVSDNNKQYLVSTNMSTKIH